MKNRLLVAVIFWAGFISLPAMAQKKQAAGSTFRDCPSCPEMVVIPAGVFMMGAAENELDPIQQKARNAK